MSNIAVSILMLVCIPVVVSIFSTFSVMILSEKYKKRLSVYSTFLSCFIKMKYNGCSSNEEFLNLKKHFSNLELETQNSIFISKGFRSLLRGFKIDAGVNPDQAFIPENPIDRDLQKITIDNIKLYLSDSNLEILKKSVQEYTSYAKSLEFLLGMDSNF